jgi:hypothetical protein
MYKGWYRFYISVEKAGRSGLLVRQIFAKTAENAVASVKEQFPEDWHVPMMGVCGPLLERLKPHELGWQPKDGAV